MKKLPAPPRMPTTHKRTKPVPNRDRTSHIKSHEYVPETGTLTITFRDGQQYRYKGVSAEVERDFAKAPSMGKFLHAHIIGKYNHTKIKP